MNQSPQPVIRRLIAALTGLLCAAGLAVLTAAPAGAAPAAPPPSCSAWIDVPHPDVNSGYVNDLHARAGTQTRKCQLFAGGNVVQARATYRTIDPDTWPRTQEGLILRISDATLSCPTCSPTWQSERIAEPAVGQTYYGPAVRVAANRRYLTDVAIFYVDPPTPYWFQTGTQGWTSPAA